MKFIDLPASVTSLWAKSDSAKGHSLLAHMLDVAAVAETILLREPEHIRIWLAENLGLTVTNATRVAATFAGLHDIGKATPGFEMKWSPGKDHLIESGFDFPQKAESNHAVSTQYILAGKLRSVLGKGLAASVCEILGAHHGVFLSPRSIENSFPSGKRVWIEAQAALFNAYWEAMSPVKPDREDRLPFPVAAWLAGLVSVADWIGSSESFCPANGQPNMGQRAETLEGHFEQARILAGDVLEHNVGWPVYTPLLQEERPISELVSAIVGEDGLQPRPLQRVGIEILENASGPVLMIVEAPMGEGKTELAYLAHLRLQRVAGHRGMYLALPTQATGNAMFRRTIRFLQSMGSVDRLDIQLAHGGAMANTDLLHLREAQGGSDEAVTSSTWFSQRRRPLLSHYGVGTVDQALMAILNVKHHFVRLFGLGHKLVVLDEVHAYDVYTSGLICSLLRWLKSLGASVVVMSATLPAFRREEFLRAWGASSDPLIDTVAYPRIMVAEASCLHARSFDARRQAAVGLAHVPEGVAALAARAASLLSGGGCGAVVVNTVKRAQELYESLIDYPGCEAELILYHARFPADERSVREKLVLSRYGKGVDRPKASLLIATQVAEQSLDVDFDFMISDLAPIDLLLQRAGRLHRHQRVRPDKHLRPILHVAGLDPSVLPELSETAWRHVYDEEILLRTWALLSREKQIQLPLDIDRLVQAVYSRAVLPADLPDGMLPRLERARLKGEQARASQAMKSAENSVRDQTDRPYTAIGAYQTFQDADEDEASGEAIVALTRLGSESVCAVPVHVDGKGMWSLVSESQSFHPDSPPGDELARRIWNRQVRLSRYDVRQGLRFSRPSCWDRHPLLRGLSALVLREGRAVFGRTTVILSQELGIIYS